LDRERDQEMRFHLAQAIQRNLERGMNPDQARRQALLDFGGPEHVKDLCRDERGTRPFEDLLRDMGYGLRQMRRNPGFTAGAVLPLALGIGLATAMFSVVDALMLQPVPFPDADRLVQATLARPERAVVEAWRAMGIFEAMEAARTGLFQVEVGGQSLSWPGAAVTPGMFDMLGVRPVFGRAFNDDTGAPGSPDGILISETVWRTYLGADPGAIGRSLRIDGASAEVIGIMPADFRFPSPATVAWRPLNYASARSEIWTIYGRLNRGLTAGEAGSRMRDIWRQLASPEGLFTGNVRHLTGPGLGNVTRRAMVMLAGGVALVFLVLCSNASSLLLTRLSARRREFGMRAALGALRSACCDRQLWNTP
jgi:hypothetical protein